MGSKNWMGFLRSKSGPRGSSGASGMADVDMEPRAAVDVCSGINPGINPGNDGVPQGPVSLVESPHDDPSVPQALGFESHQPPQRYKALLST